MLSVFWFILGLCFRQKLKELNIADPSRRLKNLRDAATDSVAIPVRVDDISDLDEIKQKLAKELHLDDKNLQLKEIDVPVAKKLQIETPLQFLKRKLCELVEDKGGWIRVFAGLVTQEK